MSTLSKVRSGAPLEIPAATFNTFIDAARDYRARQNVRSVDSVPGRQQADVILVRNDSGAARSRFDVLGLSAPLINPVNAEAADGEWAAQVALSGVTPTADYVGRFGVLLEPVADGALGRTVIAGAAWARVRMVSEDHVYADVDAGQAAQLCSSAVGTGRLLWVQPVGQRDDPEIALAVVRLGGGGGSTLEVVQVENVAGAGGGPGVAATYTYDIWRMEQDIDTDDPLNATPLTPQLQQRTLGLAYTAAARGSLALAFQNPAADGAWTLLRVNELVTEVEECD